MTSLAHDRSTESGFSLAALITFLTVVSVLVAVAVPVYTTQARRELEEELIFRGEEYVRAIQKYQRQFGVYPQDLESLLESNEMRFLRREYLDPITGEGFRLIKALPDGTLEGSRIYEFEDLPLFPGPLGSGGPAGGQDGSGEEDSPFTLFSSGPQGTASPFGAGQAGALSAGGGLARGPGLQTDRLGGGSGEATGAPSGGGGLPGFRVPGGGAGSENVGLPGFTLSGGVGSSSLGLQGVDAGGVQGAGGSQVQGAREFARTLAGDLISGGQQPGGRGGPSAGGGTGAGGPAAVITGIVGVAGNSEEVGLKIYNERSIYAEWEFIALPTTLAGAGSVPGVMPGDSGNSGQPQTFPNGDSEPFSSSPFAR